MLKWPLVWRSTWALQAESVEFFRNKWRKCYEELCKERAFRDKLLAENAKLRETLAGIDARQNLKPLRPGSTKLCPDCNSTMIPMPSSNTKVCSNGSCGKEIPWPLEEGQVHTMTGMGPVEPFVEDRSNDNRPLD